MKPKAAIKPVVSPDAVAAQPETSDSHAGGARLLLWLMVAMSGFACLVYQILWMRQIGLVFGNTSHAAALTLAVFFAGLAAGGWFWGRRCPRITNPMRTYGWLELGIAVAGAAILVGPGLIRQFYPMLYGDSGAEFGLMAFKAFWTLLLVFPASFLMGGTLPVIGQWLIRNHVAFGTTAARLYAINTLGAASGAFAAAFILVWHLGFRMTGVVAMAISAAVAVIAFMLAKRRLAGESKGDCASTTPSSRSHDRTSKSSTSLPRPAILIMAFLSGFLVLALEVLWTRMFAQVHENSVYSFSAVLIIVLICLALGAWLASRLARGTTPAPQVLMLLIAAGGSALLISPHVFMWLTKNGAMLPVEASFGAYVFRLLGTGFVAIGPACLLLGAVFPFLMKAEEKFTTHPGKSIGTLSAINTVGAILGALACGFVLLPWLGMWRTVQLAAAGYLIIALLTPAAKNTRCRAAKAVVSVVLLLSFTALNPSSLPVAWHAEMADDSSQILEEWQASDATVSVVLDAFDHVAIKINSNYSLGSSAAIGPQIFQARIPLLVFPETDSVFFLGMGTGITAGEALDRDSFPNIRKVVACELSPSVVEAAEKYFGGAGGGPDLTNGLFTDPRARVLVADGRNHLMATRDTYAMINADLFLPYRRGTGSLYSLEHFQNTRARLNPGGVFVQWLPLYQISEREFGIIARTMIEAFPQVTLWRGNFQPGAEMAALIGHLDDSPIPASTLDVEFEKARAVAGATHLDMQRLMLPINEQTIPLFYGGNLTLARELFTIFPLNTDDRPVIEYGTPRSLHAVQDGKRAQFLADRFANLVDEIQTLVPPAIDPILTTRDDQTRKLPLAGSAFHRAWIAAVYEDEEGWIKNWQIFLKHWLPSSGQHR
ncbi:MAG: spermidine synthase [Luteolibacter sp.]